MTVFLTTDQVAAIHDLQSGQPLRDRAVLAGAVNRALTGWGDDLLYPDAEAQAAVLLVSLCQAQAFVDGNKRTAWVACDVSLAINGLRIVDVSDEAVVDLMLAISTKALDESAAADWIRTHTVVAPVRRRP